MTHFADVFARRLRPAVLLLPLLLLARAQAAELRVPEPFDVLIVNGEEYSSGLKSQKTVALKVGRNVVILEYDQIFDADYGDSHDRIKSAPVALVFEVTADAVLSLVDPKLQSNTEARRYAKAPQLQLRDQQQQPVASQLLPVREINGLLLADGGNEGNRSVSGTSATVTAATAAPAVVQSTTQSTAQATAAQPAPDALQMLSYWWQQATPAQRAAFLQAITR